MSKMPLLTTTIGSLQRFREDLHESIDQALAFQCSHKLDILSDGEQRTDMISYFAESFDGLAIEKGQPLVTGKISLKGRADDFSKVQDLDYVLQKNPGLKVKVAITGPTTLGMTCASREVRSYYRNIVDFKMYEDIASALAPIAQAIVSRGAYLQLDEPFLSQGYKDIQKRVQLLDIISRGLPRDQISVHVCGFVGGFGVVEQLLRLENVETLSFGFAGRVEKANIGHVERAEFEDHNKMLGAGCIAVTPTSKDEVDTPKQVQVLLGKLAEKVGRDNIAYAHPDCGMRATNKSLISPILKSMRAGVDLLG